MVVDVQELIGDSFLTQHTFLRDGTFKTEESTKIVEIAMNGEAVVIGEMVTASIRLRLFARPSNLVQDYY